MTYSITSLSATIQAALSATIAKNTNSFNNPSATITPSNGVTLQYGTGAGYADVCWADVRTLAASTEESLNVSGGAHGGAVALLDQFGQTVVFVRIKLLYIRNTSTGAATILEIFGAGADDITTMLLANGDGFLVRPAATYIHYTGQSDATGYVVATDEVLDVKNQDAGNAATYEIAIIGTSA
jgi:hypothetical protein